MTKDRKLAIIFMTSTIVGTLFIAVAIIQAQKDAMHITLTNPNSSISLISKHDNTIYYRYPTGIDGKLTLIRRFWASYYVLSYQEEYGLITIQIPVKDWAIIPDQGD